MKQISINNLLLSVIFVLFISLPMTISFLSENASVSQTEKRALAQFPEITFSPDLLQEFPAAFDRYIEDHFGFRDRIVRTHNYLLVSLFGISPSGFVIVGSNDWYYFNADGSINDYLGSMKIGPRRLESAYYLLQDRKFWLNAIGSQYLFLPVPNKEMIYDEYLPARIRQHKGVSNFERVLGYLEEKQNFEDYIDLKQVMLKAKDERLLYLRTDSHWNHDGAFLAYRKIISKMRNRYPDIVALERSTENKMIHNFSGDLSILMNLRGLITEDAPDVVVDTNCETRELTRMDSIRTMPKYRDLETHRLPVEGGCDARKYTAVVLHDSFGRFLEPYLSQQFARVVYINFLNFEDAKEIIERERPDIVIDQRVARNLLKALRPDNDLQQQVLADRFDGLVETTLQLRGGKLLEAVAGSAGGAFSGDEGGVELELESEESFVTVNLNKADASADPEVVGIVLNSSREGKAILCYRGESAGDHEPPQCTGRKLEQGQNKLFFRVLKCFQNGTLEIRPAQPGRYRLDSITVRRETL